MYLLKTQQKTTDRWIFRSKDNKYEYILDWNSIKENQIIQDPSNMSFNISEIKLMLEEEYFELNDIDAKNQIFSITEVKLMKNLHICRSICYQFTFEVIVKELNMIDLMKDEITELKKEIENFKKKITDKEEYYSETIDFIVYDPEREIYKLNFVIDDDMIKKMIDILKKMDHGYATGSYLYGNDNRGFMKTFYPYREHQDEDKDDDEDEPVKASKASKPSMNSPAKAPKYKKKYKEKRILDKLFYTNYYFVDNECLTNFIMLYFCLLSKEKYYDIHQYTLVRNGGQHSCRLSIKYKINKTNTTYFPDYLQCNIGDNIDHRKISINDYILVDENNDVNYEKFIKITNLE